MSIYGPFPDDKTTGYKIERSVDGWRRVWVEPGEEDEHGPWLPTKADALREAATDWEDAGGVVCRLGATLRGLAARAEKQEEAT